MAYPLVHISNSTNYDASGEVSYRSAFCKDDKYTAPANKSWTAKSRGVCLVTKITATLSVLGTDHEAAPYESVGTSYSQFAIVQLDGGNFVVTRVVSALEDQPPANYVEPTTQQN
jgi:hypothetical protein